MRKTNKLLKLSKRKPGNEIVFTPQEIALMEARLDECEKHPNSFVPWEEAEARLRARFTKN